MRGNDVGSDRRADSAGVVALEFALLLPVVGLLLLAVVLAGVHAVDQLTVQEAARVAARVASVTRAGPAPVEAAREAAGQRTVFVVVAPAVRRAGGDLRATVRHTRDVGFLHWTVSGTAVAVAEPVVGP